MFKKLFSVVLFVALSFGAQAQFVFDEGDIAINAGVGFFSMDGTLPSLYLSAELGLIPTNDIGVLSIGGVMEHKYSKVSGQYYNQASIAPRIIWHFHFPFLDKTKFDLYTGLGSGLHHYRDYNLTTFVFDRKITPYMEFFIGGRMIIGDRLGVFVEAGANAMAVLKFGAAYRL